MATEILMQYGSYNFTPVPTFTLNKQYQKTPDGTLVGTVFDLAVDGVLYAPTGGLSVIMGMQEVMRSGLANDGRLFQILCNSGVLLSCYPRVSNLQFNPSPNNWVITCPYSFTLQFDDEPQPTGTGGSLFTLGENSGVMPPFISDAQESWTLESVEDKSYYSLTLDGPITDSIPFQFRLTHNVSAVGKRRYAGGTLDMQAWQQARNYVVSRLGYNSAYVTGSGVLNLTASQYAPFNHIRTNNSDLNAGTFSSTETWLLVNSGAAGVAGNAVEDFTVDVKKGVDSDLTTVTIQGTIQGLEVRSYGTNPGDFAVTTSKFENAQSYWSTILGQSRPYLRAKSFGGSLPRGLNITPIVHSLGSNPANGLVTYSYEYNDRPQNCIPGSTMESIIVNDSNPTDVFAELGIPGRANGPILQDMGTVTSAKREVTIDVIMKPFSGLAGCSVAQFFTENPRTSVDAIIAEFYADLISSGHTQIFKHIDSENWEPRTGHYSRQVGWTYQLGC